MPDTPPEIVDSHCHLDFPQFAEDLDGVLARARAAGVTRMLTIATRMADEPRVRAIASAHPGVYYAAGVHPMQVAEAPAVEQTALEALAAQPKLVAIGETGLDFHYTAETAAAQEASFRTHIAAARATGLPVIIHARAADDAIARILTEEYRKGAFSGVMHCYASGPALARTALDLGLYLSMSGIVTFPKAEALRAIFAAAPLDRVLVETDAPYLAPVPHRGRRNEPAYTALTAACGAAVMGVDPVRFARATTENFDRLFPRAVG